MAALNPRLGDFSNGDRRVLEQFGRYRIIKRLGELTWVDLVDRLS